MVYAEIVLPLAGGVFTYSVEGSLVDLVQVGCVVGVPFGPSKVLGGVVRRLHEQTPAFATKPVASLLFPTPVVSEVQLKFWDWLVSYYMCSLGEVMRVAMPSKLKPKAKTAEDFSASGFRRASVRMVGLSSRLATADAFNGVCENLKQNAPKQYQALMQIADGGGVVPRSGIDVDGRYVNLLIKKGFVTSEDWPEGLNVPDIEFDLPALSPAQQVALQALRCSFRSLRTSLLFGVSASGKSEICFHAIAGALSRGRDVLLLLPEIALTTQFVERVRRIFGERVVLYHSAMGVGKRSEIYLRLALSKGGSLIVGARSAIFLPMPNLGLVVVDEEQDIGFKQNDPAPRYNARDAAIVLAGLSDARVILSSATPSLETWANAIGGRYGLVEIAERWGAGQSPKVFVSDTLRAIKRHERHKYFNKELLDRMKEALERGEQIILFQNCRGVAPLVECGECGHVPKCPRCAIPMKVHKRSMKCHYCSATAPVPQKCPKCGAEKMVSKGFGTERIEEELAFFFPAARIARLDRDTATSEKAFRRIIGDFAARHTDILIGTQMVTKGLDFDGVSLVGVLSADNLLNHPDFRASERAYAQIAQVAGRSGRRESRGEVVIQTVSPNNPVIRRAAAGDFRTMATDLLAERARYGYPPASRLVQIMVRHSERDAVEASATRLKTVLESDFSDRLLGPETPLTELVRGKYALVFLLKIPRTESMTAVREKLQAAIKTVVNESRKTIVTINVDP